MEAATRGRSLGTSGDMNIGHQTLHWSFGGGGGGQDGELHQERPYSGPVLRVTLQQREHRSSEDAVSPQQPLGPWPLLHPPRAGAALPQSEPPPARPTTTGLMDQSTWTTQSTKIPRMATISMIHGTRVRSPTHAKPECPKNAASHANDCSLALRSHSSFCAWSLA
jgi:hypothetical protein